MKNSTIHICLKTILVIFIGMILMDDVFPEEISSFEIGNTKLIITKEISKSIFNKSSFCSKIYAKVIEGNKSNIIWENSFSDPQLSGTGDGLLNDIKVCQLEPTKEVLIILSLRKFSEGTLFSIIRINPVDNFLVKKYNFVEPVNLGGVKIFLVQYNNLLLVGVENNKNQGKKYEYAYDAMSNILLKLASPSQLLYPYCPWELCIYSEFSNRSMNEEVIKLSEEDFEKFSKYSNMKQFGKFSKFSLRFNTFLARYESQFFHNMIGTEQNEEAVSDEIKKTTEQIKIPYINLVTLWDSQMANNEVGHKKNLVFLYSVSKAIEKRHSNPKELSVSPEEINTFYRDFRWVFLKENRKDVYPIEEVKDFIASEIRHLKYYHMDELLTKPPKIEIKWGENVNSLSSGRGLLDAPPPEEAARLKAEFLATQPLDFVFNEAEMSDLFKEPDYGNIADLYTRALEYDWYGKFGEAQECLVKVSEKSLAAKFMLGSYYKYGRQDVIMPDTVKAEETFKSIIEKVGAKSGIPTSEEYYWQGRAYWELRNLTKEKDLEKKAMSALTESGKNGFNAALFYIQYANLGTTKFNPAELVKLAETGDIEVKALLALMVLMNNPAPAFKQYRNQNGERNKFLGYIKEAIKQHNVSAQTYLGSLYSDNSGNSRTALKYNMGKAKFWLQRASVRGDQYALNLLKDRRYKD